MRKFHRSSFLHDPQTSIAREEFGPIRVTNGRETESFRASHVLQIAVGIAAVPNSSECAAIEHLCTGFAHGEWA
jgi:hypothetical protein